LSDKKRDVVRASLSGAKVFSQWEADVSKRTWGRALNQDELQLWIAPDVTLTEDSNQQQQELERRKMRDLFFQRMAEKKAKWV
jgi:hypothetical protein